MQTPVCSIYFVFNKAYSHKYSKKYPDKNKMLYFLENLIGFMHMDKIWSSSEELFNFTARAQSQKTRLLECGK